MTESAVPGGQSPLRSAAQQIVARPMATALPWLTV